ncbi:MAG: sirohydrochlorin cobaltochelatase [Bacteroides sp.]|nr:sirohydrochlorin cobaltochelatase [Bacteroides sp.]
MRRILILLTVILSCTVAKACAAEPADGEKHAILMAHFGTTYDDTRALTIDALNEKVKTDFPDMDVFEAYTSRIIISRLKKRGIVKSTPREMLLKLAAEGYTHVFIQGTNIIDGIESETLRDDVEFMIPFFKDIRVGYPLLYSIEDCEKVVGILAERHEALAGKHSAVVLIGHGTATPANAIYSQIDYMFNADGHGQFHVATVEGYPTFDTTLAKLKASKVKKVTLLPFMFVAGDHARNDIDGEWCENLVKEGYEVSTIMEGLGQIPAIQDIYVDHIRQGLNERPLKAMERKAAFLRDNLR